MTEDFFIKTSTFVKRFSTLPLTKDTKTHEYFDFQMIYTFDFFVILLGLGKPPVLSSPMSL